MNDKGLFCSAVILIISLQGCAQMGTQVARVKSALPGKHHSEKVLTAARSFEHKKEWLAARKQYEVYLKKNPRSVVACHRLGIVCSQLGDSVAATRYFTQAKQLDPNNSEVLNDFGYALYKRAQYDAAEKVLTAALQNDANNKRIMNNLALTVGHQGRFKESYTLFRNIMPEAEAHANVAYIHTQRGEGEMALKEYDLALTADPTLEAAGLAAAELAVMKNIYVAKQEKQPQVKEEQQLASTQPQPAQTVPEKPVTKNPFIEKTVTKESVASRMETAKPSAEQNFRKIPAQQTTQLVSAKEVVPVVSRQSLDAPVKETRQKLVSQAALKKELLAPSQPTTPAARIEPQVQKQEEEFLEPLEINSFRSLDEITDDEITDEDTPAIIRISNEIPAEEPMFRSPDELTGP
ncbi:Tetratricopeptide repeat protein [Gimesia maris]|nr:Tetratricopeptide repeat protein [Gimesia maris]